ncbi:hypothetical protein DYI37_18435 [Fulvimarina endophytica]|uniref:Uncharacterized protein n=1 Tax=Fulvimarina endophytica TaxID=2293836 RepID=A0A371WYL8_9HYPH|nr:hypothetical protein DYI37_18435 [Fulvimarina endophytica]
MRSNLSLRPFSEGRSILGVGVALSDGALDHHSTGEDPNGSKVGARLVDDGYLRPAKRVRSIVLLTRADRVHPFVDRQVMPPGARMIRSAAAARSGVVVDRPASQPGTMEQARPR